MNQNNEKDENEEIHSKNDYIQEIDQTLIKVDLASMKISDLQDHGLLYYPDVQLQNHVKKMRGVTSAL